MVAKGLHGYFATIYLADRTLKKKAQAKDTNRQTHII